MHEYGIAQQMMSLALAHAQENRAARVTRFHIEMSRTADESADSLRFYLEMLSRGTLAQGAAFEIECATQVRCLDCDCEFMQKNLADACPRCGSVRLLPLPADEFKLTRIEID